MRNQAQRARGPTQGTPPGPLTSRCLKEYLLGQMWPFIIQPPFRLCPPLLSSPLWGLLQPPGLLRGPGPWHSALRSLWCDPDLSRAGFSLPSGLCSKVALRPSVASLSIILSLILLSKSLPLLFLYSTYPYLTLYIFLIHFLICFSH